MENFEHTSPHSEVELAAALRRVAAELNRIETSAIRLETATSAVLRSARDMVECDIVTEFQEFDLLIQSISNVAGFLKHLSQELPQGQVTDISAVLTSVKMGDMADRLAGTSPNETSERKNAPHPEPDLF